jgi:ribosomal protein L27
MRCEGDFAYENVLITLVEGPKKVDGNFCVAGNILRNLVGCPEFVGGNFHFDDTLISTYSGQTNCRIAGKVKIYTQNEITRNKLPIEILQNATHLHYVLKYQQYYEVWNDDFSLNKSNF